MKSIKASTSVELLINKSTFINYLIPVSNVDEVKIELEILRKKYNDASHHCFAYIIGNNQEIQKYSDDGEPSKTAGFPMIEVLKKHDLTNVMNVSVRYFGGIKLGAGGLVRAYTKGCAESVKKATFTYLANYTKIIISIPFDQIGNVEKHIRDSYTLLETKYDENVNYIINVQTSLLSKLKSELSNLTKGASTIEEIESYDTYE